MQYFVKNNFFIKQSTFGWLHLIRHKWNGHMKNPVFYSYQRLSFIQERCFLYSSHILIRIMNFLHFHASTDYILSISLMEL